MIARNYPRASWLLLLSVVCGGCNSHEGPPGKVLVRNDIQDSDYNIVEIDNVATKAGPTTFHRRLKPGEKVVLPFKKITAIRFSRTYKDYTRVYEVRCPGEDSPGYTLKLIDVHTGRLQGGCSLERRGEKRRGGDVIWEKAGG